MITQYTKREGSIWLDWPVDEPTPHGLPLENILKDLHATSFIVLAGIDVHALRFDDGREWDCVNGWREGLMWTSRHSKQVPIHDVEEFYKEPPKLGDSLREASNVINGERQDSYGNPEDSFGLIAEYWDVYLKKVFPGLTINEGIQGQFALSALDVAHMMMLFKIARCSGQSPSRDSYIDIQGYAAIAADKLVKP